MMVMKYDHFCEKYILGTYLKSLIGLHDGSCVLFHVWLSAVVINDLDNSTQQIVNLENDEEIARQLQVKFPKRFYFIHLY